MRIRSVVIENFRSIERVELGPLGPVAVFYGPNGAGKSNLLRAIGLAFAFLRVHASSGRPISLAPSPGLESYGDSDVRVGEDAGSVTLEIEGLSGIGGRPEGIPPLEKARVRVDFERAPNGAIGLTLGTSPCTFDDGRSVDLSDLLSGGPPPDWHGGDSKGVGPALSRWVRQRLLGYLGERGFHEVDDVRSFKHRRTKSEARPAYELSPLELLEAGRVEEAMARAGTSSDDTLRDGFEKLRRLLREPPLGLPDVVPVADGQDFRLRVRTADKQRTLAASAASLGEQQVLVILGAILFRGARCVSVEEPEAHLHAPTTGRALREVLARLVAEGMIDQIFIATHSNLFDLDPTGFWSVERGEHGTEVRREPDLARIDEQHLFEPGAAKRVLQDVLRYGNPNEVIAYGVDGTPITAQQMLEDLQNDTPSAVRYASALSRATARWFIRQKPSLGTGNGG